MKIALLISSFFAGCLGAACVTKLSPSRPKKLPCDVRGDIIPSRQDEFEINRLFTAPGATMADCIGFNTMHIGRSISYNPETGMCKVYGDALKPSDVAKSNTSATILTAGKCYVRSGDCRLGNPSFEFYAPSVSAPWSLGSSTYEAPFDPPGGNNWTLAQGDTPDGRYYAQTYLLGRYDVQTFYQPAILEPGANYTLSFVYNFVSASPFTSSNPPLQYIFQLSYAEIEVDTLYLNVPADVGVGWRAGQFSKPFTAKPFNFKTGYERVLVDILVSNSNPAADQATFAFDNLVLNKVAA